MTETRSAAAGALADELMPTYDRAVRTTTTVALPLPEVDTLLHWVATDDMPFFRWLMAVRSLGRSLQDREMPVLELLDEYEGLQQQEVPGREIVTAARRFRWYWRFAGRWGAAVFGHALLGALRRHTRRGAVADG
jgi:hypothetical protein